MSSLLDAPPEKSGAASCVAVVGTLAAHGALVLAASLFGARAVAEVRKLLPISEMVEVEMPEPPPHAETPAPEAAPAKLKSAPATPTPPAPPPAAAQAGQVLAAKADAVDFGDSIVSGSGDAYAGGITDSQGTSTKAVTDLQAHGAGAAPTPKPAAPEVDLSRPPRLAGGSRWDCPFPLEADDAGIDHSVVTLRVDVTASGSVSRVSVLSDPGNGFGREARRCAQTKPWLAGVDRLGNASATSITVNVRFDR